MSINTRYNQKLKTQSPPVEMTMEGTMESNINKTNASATNITPTPTDNATPLPADNKVCQLSKNPRRFRYSFTLEDVQT